MLEGVAAYSGIHQTVSSFYPSTYGVLSEFNTNLDNYNRKGVDPDFSEALIVRNNATIEDVCDQIHRTLKDNFKYALVWGASARHVPQRVGLGHVIADEDVVSIATK